VAGKGAEVLVASLRLEGVLERHGHTLGARLRRPGSCTRVGQALHLGGGQRLRADLQYGLYNDTLGTLQFTNPRFTLPFTKKLCSLRAELFSTQLDHVFEASHLVDASGISLSLTDKETGRHTVRYEGEWRDVKPMAGYDWKYAFRPFENYSHRDVSPSVLSLARSSVKSSFSYIFTKDRVARDMLPRSGAFFQSTTELAGFGGDVHFLKNHSIASLFIPIASSVTFGLSAQAGAVTPTRKFLSRMFPNLFSQNVGADSDIHLCDRFKLNLPGFQRNSCGPSDAGDFTGGNVLATLSAQLNFPLVPSWNLWGRLFSTLGHSLLSNYGMPHERFKHLMTDWRHARLSVGAGILIPISGASVELSAAWPIRHEVTDRPCWHGVRVHLGTHF